ncbi:uncharacterized protein STEHIDRAFT_153990 [Stereum hirsutum FP-91666 SS1]|uniref:uncharacterized protein n=1 Tax=Stereum hirsutum (strain FP-91666) TaxID=721885 RepID=UPI000440E80A|nr:uncharacterized protein STEHIDRAFT_153990 [Stereum hirsutum FP-91666 SS1]EIM90157.1 hypothetical protein STEHIDRAFT_153990 [Stereum hirsutum FP-91666 SS1]
MPASSSQPPSIDLQTLFTLASGLPEPNAENVRRATSSQVKDDRRTHQLLDALATLAVCKAKGQVVAVGVTITQDLVTLYVAENCPVPQTVVNHLKDIVRCIRDIRSRIPGSPPYVQDPAIIKQLDDLEDRVIGYAWPKLRQRFRKRYDDFNKLLRDVVYEDGNVHAEADRSNPPDDHTLAYHQHLLKDLRDSDAREKLTKFAEALRVMDAALRDVVTPTKEDSAMVNIAMQLLEASYGKRVVNKRGQDVLNLCTLYLDRSSYDLARWINKLITPHRNFSCVSRLVTSTSLAPFIDPKVEVVAVHPQPPISISVNITLDTIRQAAQESGWKKDEEKDGEGKSIGDHVLEQVFLDLPKNLRLPKQDVPRQQIQPKYESVYPHCECMLLASLHRQAGLYAYFGVSKLLCTLCGECFAAYRAVTTLEIHTRGSHSQLVAPWVCPKFSEKNVEVQEKMRESILQKISNGLEALQSAEKARQKSESSVASDDSYVQRPMIHSNLTAAMLRAEQVMKAREQFGV